MGVSTLSASLKSKKRNATIQKLEIIKKAIDDFEKVNDRFPCVGRRDAVRGEADYAGEVDDCTTGHAISPPNPPGVDYTVVQGNGGELVRIGVVPTRSLGLPDSFFRDGWDNRFLYAVTENMADPNIGGNDIPDIDVEDEFGIPVVIASTFSYVILSHGQDSKGSYLFGGIGAQAASCGTAGTQDEENCDDLNALFRDTLFNDGQTTANFFDDLIVWKAESTAPPTEGRPWIGVAAPNNDKWITNDLISFIAPADIDTGYDSNDNGVVEASEKFWFSPTEFRIPAGISKIQLDYFYRGTKQCFVKNNGVKVATLGYFSGASTGSSVYDWSSVRVVEVPIDGSARISFDCLGTALFQVQIQAIECLKGCEYISAP